MTKGAEAGQIDAQAALGVLLAGLVDPPQLEEAETWLAKAAHSGHPGALELLTKYGD